jgi:hypothetical protein
MSNASGGGGDLDEREGIGDDDSDDDDEEEYHEEDDYVEDGSAGTELGIPKPFGRPLLKIDLTFVRELRNKFFSWRMIAKFLSVDERTLRRRVKQNGYTDDYPFASMEQLMALFAIYKQETNYNPGNKIIYFSLNCSICAFF